MISAMPDRHAALIARMFSRFGGTATLRRSTTTASTPWGGGTTTTEEWAVQLIETGADAAFSAANGVVNGDLVAAMLPHASVTPQPLDVLAIGGDAYALVSVEAVRADPDGPVMHFRLHGRR